MSSIIFMKKIIIFIFLIIINSIYATPVGNPFDPALIEEGFFISHNSLINFRLGYEGNFVSDAKLKKQDQTRKKVDNCKINDNSGTFILNLKNRLDLYVNAGVTRLGMSWRFSNNAVKSRIELESNYRFVWSVGEKIILCQWENTVLDIGARYSKTKPTIDFIILDGVPQEKANSKLKYREWQVDLGVAHSIDVFTPYLGIKFSQKSARVSGLTFVVSDDAETQLSMKDKERQGVYAGVTLSNKTDFLLTFEARFLDEDAISVFGELRF